MKQLCTFLLFIFFTIIGFSQSPQKFSYQSVLRNAGNQLVANQQVGIRISILQGDANGTAVYAETHSPLSNANGLVTLEIGGGAVLSGNFANINWASGPYFVKTETDLNGGSTYTLTSTQQLLSVPYALYSSSSNTATTAANGVPAGGLNGQVLTNCNGVATWTTAGQCPGTVSSLNCAGANNSGTLNANQAANGVSSSIQYTGGGGGTHNGQIANSTGVTGLTATLAAGTFATGAGNLIYTISGTPASSGTANFNLSIGGQTCTLNRTVGLPSGSISALNCANAISNGTLTSGLAASSVNSSVPYIGGNGGTHGGQAVASTGVIGLSATLTAGTFANGAGNLTYTITGTPTSGGTASFALNIGGQTCTLTRIVGYPIGTVSALNCTNAITSGTLISGVSASNVSYSVPYTGGNGGTYTSQTLTSTGVTGLSATLAAGNFVNGTGSLTYFITGTPASFGIASFALNIGGKSCTLTLNVVLSGGQSGLSAHSCGTDNVLNPATTYGSLTDQQGNVYRTVVIGNQLWMAENLKTSIYRNGDPIANVTNNNQWASLTTGAWCFYNNDSLYNCPYGKLYNWYACMDSRGLCPIGWHVPTFTDWGYLDSFVEGSSVQLKSTGTLESGTGLWHAPNANANNNLGFSAIPGGIRNYSNGSDLSFSAIGNSSNLWSSTIAGPVWSYILDYSYSFTYLYDNTVYSDGLNVRCIKD